MNEDIIDVAPRPAAAKEYMGDGVYVCLNDGGCLTLTSENGVSVLDSIHLEPAVLAAIVGYAKRVGVVR